MRPSDANVTLIMPDESERTINLIRMLVHTQNAEFKAKFGMFLPHVGKLHPTVRSLRDEYGIPARTWADAAEQMRAFYEAITVELRSAMAVAS